MGRCDGRSQERKHIPLPPKRNRDDILFPFDFFLVPQRLCGTRLCHPRNLRIFLTIFLIAWVGCSSHRDPRTVVMLIDSGPLSLDPRIGTDAESERIGSLVFDSLLRRDRHANIQPWLAEWWEVPNPLTYIFHLRPNVRFHNGKTLTSRDVRYTFESLLSGEVRSLKTSTYSWIESIEAPDDLTVVFRLKQPFGSFLWNLTQGGLGIIPESTRGDAGTIPVGSGPFRFAGAQQDQQVILERNPDYWGHKPRMDRVEFKIVPDAVTRALELRKGSADVVLNSLTADMVEVLRREKGLAVEHVPGSSYQYLAFNLQDQRLSQPVRQAIAHSIDRQAMIEHLWRGMARPADSILPPENWAHAPDLPPYRFDPGKAKELLDGAGLRPGPDGVRLRLVMKTSTDQTARALAAVLQAQLRNIGIALEIRSFEFATFYSDISHGNFDLFSLRWISGNDDPGILDYCFSSQKLPPAGANRGHYVNPELDRLLTDARTAAGIAARRQSYIEIQKILNHDLPYISLWYLDDVAVYNRRLRNLRLSATGNYDFLTEVEISGPGPN